MKSQTRKLSQKEITSRYSLNYGHERHAIITAPSVDDAVKFARRESKKTGFVVEVWDYAARFVAKINPDGTLGGNGSVTRYEC